jgi:carboxypeptidase Taq
MPSPYAELLTRYAEIRDLSAAQSLAGWDQEVMMPPGGAGSRAWVMAALAGAVHERSTDKRLAALAERLWRGRARLAPLPRRQVELARRAVRKARRIPADLARELALAESRGLETWREARRRRDWKHFAPSLQRMVTLKRRVAQLAVRSGESKPRSPAPLYDALLDDFEPGLSCTELDALLGELRAFTVPLLQQVVASRQRIDLSPLVGRFEIEPQRAFAREVVEAMGIELQRGRLDLSTHPFCSGFSPGDVRMTGRFSGTDLRGGLFGVVHEAGHGLYEQGLDPARAREPVGGAVSMALHESQSRLWENLVARSRPFWVHWLPRLKRQHPSLRRVTVDAIWRAANVVQPSFIRVEADELTYNLHIVLRTEIERDLIQGRQDVRDLPARWNDGMKSLLGLRPKHDAEGVLQDIHWAMGLFGYFPTYSLGNLCAAQFMEAARHDLSGLDARIARGELRTLREWLREHIHRHDQRLSAERLVRRVTGRPLGVEAFARHVRARVAAVYGLRAA